MEHDDKLPAPRNEKYIEYIKNKTTVFEEHNGIFDVMIEPVDIGDVSEPCVPKARDLDHAAGDLTIAYDSSGQYIAYDGTYDGERVIECDKDTFIDDVRQHN